MGQVAIDLPDPMHNSPPAPGPGVDDLLAQLAGEEIDRLLAEADVERPVKSAATSVILLPPEPLPPELPPAPALAPTAANSFIIAPSATDPAQSQVEPQSFSPPPPTAPLAPADVDELDARVAHELNNLFTELDAPNPLPSMPPSSRAQASAKSPPVPASPPAPPPPDPSTEVAVAAVLAAAPAPPTDPIAQAREIEKQLLDKAMLDVLGGAAEVEKSTRLPSLNLSFLLRPLEWLNAPLSACSDAAREALGKVALMTLINALAILLYVLFLRKH
jgi:hypothetical protein